MSQVAGQVQAASYTAAVDRPPVTRARRRRGVYVAITALMIAIVIAGFWPYFAAGGRGDEGRPWLIHVHAAVYSGWMVLLLTQVMLVWRGRTDLHRRIGRVGIAYGVGVLLLGLVATIVAPLAHVASGAWTMDRAAGFLILPIGDMMLFAGFFAAGVAWRRRPETHRRCMMLATIALMFAPAARLAGDANAGLLLGIWLLPLLIAIGDDLWKQRRVHRVHAVGAIVLLVAFGRILLMETPAWLRIGRGILTAFGAG